MRTSSRDGRRGSAFLLTFILAVGGFLATLVGDTFVGGGGRLFC